MVDKSISVVIPNYNGRNLLKENLPSVVDALRCANCEFQIFVIDDASTDDSVEFIRANYPEVILLQNDVNQGFSVTANRGIMQATNDLVLILNSDVSLDKNYFSSQFKYFEDEDTFGVMGQIRDFESDQTIDAAKYPSLSILKGGINGTRNFSPVNTTKSDNRWIPTFFLSGANALCDRKKIQEIGGFDEIYSPFYYEDLDLSLRAWRLGWNCWYEENAVCRHAPSTSIKKSNPKKKVNIITNRNKLILHAIHLEKTYLIKWNLLILFKLLFSGPSFKLSFYKVFWMFFKKREEIKFSKRKLAEQFEKNGIRRSLPEVVRALKSEILEYRIRRF